MSLNRKKHQHKFIILLLILSACAFRVRTNPALQGVQAPVADWYAAPDRWQIQYVAAVVDAGNSTGVRCPAPLSVGAIRYELLTRINQGSIKGTDLVYDQINNILREQGCRTVVSGRPAGQIGPLMEDGSFYSRRINPKDRRSANRLLDFTKLNLSVCRQLSSNVVSRNRLRAVCAERASRTDEAAPRDYANAAWPQEVIYGSLAEKGKGGFYEN